MAREVKPGKKFIYSLENVLKVKRIREKKEQEKFAVKQKEFYEEKMKEQKIRDDKRSQTDEFKQIVSGGKLDFAKVLSRRQHLNVLKEDLDNQIEKVLEASQKLNKQREKLLEAVKDRKIMDKDKENKYGQYKEIMKQIEIKFLDEIATLRFSRDKNKEG